MRKYFLYLLVSMVFANMVAPVWADGYDRMYDAHARQYVYVEKKNWADKLFGGIKNFCREPILRKGVVGGGIGVGAAAMAEKNLLKGGLVGVGVGAGWAVLDDSKTMERRPLLRSMSKGALAGVGASAVTGGLGALPGAAIGAGIGAAAHFARK